MNYFELLWITLELQINTRDYYELAGIIKNIIRITLCMLRQIIQIAKDEYELSNIIMIFHELQLI